MHRNMHISKLCDYVCHFHSHLFLYKVLYLKPNGAHSVSPLPRPFWIPRIPAAFMHAHGLAVCTPQYCTDHKHEQATDSTAMHFRE